MNLIPLSLPFGVPFREGVRVVKVVDDWRLWVVVVCDEETNDCEAVGAWLFCDCRWDGDWWWIRWHLWMVLKVGRPPRL